MNNQLERSDGEWKKMLTPEEYRVMREKGTERPFSGQYWNHDAAGIYACAACGAQLFSSGNKFDAGCGWPSFSDLAARDGVRLVPDDRHGMNRTEVVCARCDSHLGHVFEDGPQPTGLRYCINSVALDFKGDSRPRPEEQEVATFGAGCFWCVEAVFERLAGVRDVKVGYMGGQLPNPTYRQVCSGTTGHAEVAQIRFDPHLITFERLLDVFWKTHDPTSLNRQGADTGTQYRSVIFFHSEKQKVAAEKSKAALAASGTFAAPIVTSIAPASDFHEAEAYHQDYYRQNAEAPYCRAVIAPKLKKIPPDTVPAGAHDGRPASISTPHIPGGRE